MNFTSNFRSLLPASSILLCLGLSAAAHADYDHSSFLVAPKLAVEDVAVNNSVFTASIEKGSAEAMEELIEWLLIDKAEGYAIVTMSIPNFHDLDQQPAGAWETGREIVAKLAGVRLKANLDLSTNFDKDPEAIAETIIVELRGKSQLTAGDIGQASSAFEAMNPDWVVAVIDPAGGFIMELEVAYGEGYQTAKKNKKAKKNQSSSLSANGRFSVVPRFTPVVQVSIDAEPIRDDGNPNNLERLIIDVTTDGTQTPSEVVKSAMGVVGAIGARFSGKKF